MNRQVAFTVTLALIFTAVVGAHAETFHSSDYLFTTAAATAGKTYYVATTSNDRNPGTQTLPFRTISRGINFLKPGDTLLVRGAP